MRVWKTDQKVLQKRRLPLLRMTPPSHYRQAPQQLRQVLRRPLLLRNRSLLQRQLGQQKCSRPCLRGKTKLWPHGIRTKGRWTSTTYRFSRALSATYRSLTKGFKAAPSPRERRTGTSALPRRIWRTFRRRSSVSTLSSSLLCCSVMEISRRGSEPTLGPRVNLVSPSPQLGDTKLSRGQLGEWKKKEEHSQGTNR